MSSAEVRVLKISMTATALAFLATAATAQTPTSAPDPARPSQTATPAADPTADQIASWIGGRHGEVEGLDAQPVPQRDGKVHGEVGASIGSGGYKSGYGVATMPIGDKGDLTVGLADEHLGRGNRGYGPGGYSYGSGGDRRSLFIGLDLTGDHAARCDRTAARSPRSLGDPTWGTPGYGGGDPACTPNAPDSQPTR